MKKIISMILVGGKGTRLKDMTRSKAKPAISFGAKYRLIDFTLSNISHSYIDTCGMITQYEPLELMTYIGNGASWDLDYIDGGVHFLTPYLKQESIQWQKGTGHAIKQYFEYIEHQNPQYVMILPGDHIYKMDYNLMIDAIEKENADIMIATTVLNQDLSRFGVLDIDEHQRVLSFTEKPENPKSNKVSMGIYIFKKAVLEELLFSDAELLDFGNDIIPEAIRQNKKILAFEHRGYWRDVGTIESLYEAHMDMLDDPNFLDLNSSKNLPVYSRSLNLRPHIMAYRGDAQSSIIADGCLINGTIRHSSIAYQVTVKQDAFIKDACIMSHCIIGHGAHLEKVIVNEGVQIPDLYRSVNDQVVLITEDNLYEVGEIDE
jgi:glucose-1-phosphate adenylyltransferase